MIAIIHHSSWTFTSKPWTKLGLQTHNNSSRFTKLSLMNFHFLVMNWIKTYQVHNNHQSSRNCFSWTFGNKLWAELILPSSLKCITIYKTNEVHIVSLIKLPIWTSWTKSWTILFSSVSDEQFTNTVHELVWWPLMNVHECSWTSINVHHLMIFISPG